MGNGGALLMCSLFFLYVAHPACSCSVMSQVFCKRYITHSEGPQPCGGHLLQCRNSTLEIKFGGRGQWYRVVGEEIISNDYKFEIEDPALSHIFQDTDCDFLYSFPLLGPLFDPPLTQTLPNSPGDLQSYCNESGYSLLFSKLIKRYQRGRCATYDLSYTSKELQQTALTKLCLPGPDPPVFIWKLWMNNNSGPTFNTIEAGFSRRRGLYRSCFNCEMREGHCESGSAGYYTCGKRRRHKVRMITIGFSTATGLSILAGLLFYLWRRQKKMMTPSSSTLFSKTGATFEPSSYEDPEATSIIYPTHVFRYEELHEATNGFNTTNVIEHGGHGIVYRGTLPDGRTVAIKRLYENNCKSAEQFINEIAILSRLRHPNLVALHGCTSRHSRELLLVYEFIPNGTIADHLHGRRAAEGALVWPLRLRIAVESAKALAYLHAIKPQIIHRDVKTNNILLDVDFHVKVADFGLSRLFPVAASHVSTVPQGTPGYVDPEYHRCYQLTDKSDVYSFGVVLAELISSKPAVDVTRCQHEINLSYMALDKIQNAALQELVDPKMGFATDWKVRRSIEMVAELAMRCLQGEREMRPTMEGVLEVLQGIADGLHEAEMGGKADHAAEDGMGLRKNCVPASPDSVMCKWSSRMTTPSASG